MSSFWRWDCSAVNWSRSLRTRSCNSSRAARYFSSAPASLASSTAWCCWIKNNSAALGGRRAFGRRGRSIATGARRGDCGCRPALRRGNRADRGLGLLVLAQERFDALLALGGRDLRLAGNCLQGRVFALEQLELGRGVGGFNFEPLGGLGSHRFSLAGRVDLVRAGGTLLVAGLHFACNAQAGVGGLLYLPTGGRRSLLRSASCAASFAARTLAAVR